MRRSIVEPEQQAGRLKALTEVEVRLVLPADLLVEMQCVDLATAFGVASCLVERGKVMAVAVRAASGAKCPLCWRVLPEVEQN